MNTERDKVEAINQWLCLEEVVAFRHQSAEVKTSDSLLAQTETGRVNSTGCPCRFIGPSCRFHLYCVVIPIYDLSIPDKEHSNAVPGLDCEIREIIYSLINYHRSSRKGI